MPEVRVAYTLRLGAQPRLACLAPAAMRPPAFEFMERRPGATYWECRIRDAIVGDEPVFRYTPPKKGCPFTVQALAVAAAGELNERTGEVCMQEYDDGIPSFSAWFVANTRQVYCVWSTDATRAQPVDITAALHAWRQHLTRTSTQEAP